MRRKKNFLSSFDAARGRRYRWFMATGGPRAGVRAGRGTWGAALGTLLHVACANTASGTVGAMDASSSTSDRNSVSDRSELAPADGGNVQVDAGNKGNRPRLLAPMSTSYVSSHRPTLTWVNEPGVMQTVEICQDRACTVVIQSETNDLGRFKPAAPLDIGTHFWRVRRGNGATSEASHIWQFRVRSRHDLTDYYYGHYLDVNGDGIEDVVAEDTRTNARLLLGSPGGLVLSGVRLDAHPRYMSSVAVGDVNGDGLGDVLMYQAAGTCEGCVSNFADVYWGSQREGLSPVAMTMFANDAPTLTAQYRALGDVDGDGFGDFGVGTISTSGNEGPRVVVFFGNETRVPFRREVFAFGSASTWYPLAVGDLDGDGRRDFLLSNLCDMPRTLTRFDLAAYQGRFPVTPSPLGPGCSARDSLGSWTTSLADIDGDGVLDVAVGTFSLSPRDASYFRLTEGVSPGWRRLESYPVSRGDYSRHLQDFDRDGYLDDLDFRVENDWRVASVTVLFGSSTGWRRGPPFSITGMAGCTSAEATRTAAVAATGDYDGDGATELIVVCSQRLYTMEVSPTGESGPAMRLDSFPMGGFLVR
jgi:hypothetical protein